MKKIALFIAVAAASLALHATPVLAVAITRDFNLDFTSGSLAGQNFAGTFTYDDALMSGVGPASLGPVGGGVYSPGFLAFNLTVGADTFVLAGAFMSPPRLDFLDGAVTGLSYFGIGSAGGMFAGGALGVSGDSSYLSPSGGSSAGTITLKPVAFQPTIVPPGAPLGNSVPEGGSTLLLLGMVVAGFAARRGGQK